LAKKRILIAKCGLDGHDRGAKIVASALRDAGFEVIYLGRRQTSRMVVQAAIEEDVDAIGISTLSGAHMTIFFEILKILKDEGAADIMVFGGGVIDKEDIQALETMGVKKIFTPGSFTSEIVTFLKDYK
jgi:methylmalonyl-CoA mutase C-terminal domain/subunit